MNFRTFVVCFLLALPVQLDKLIKTGSLGFIEALFAILGACGIALFWAYIATWLRNKFAKDLSDSYILKIQLGFSSFGILLLIFAFIKYSDPSNPQNSTIIDRASLEVRAEMALIKECKNNPNNDPAKCEEVSDILSKCIKDLNKPDAEIVNSIQICSSQIQGSNNQ